MVFSRLQQLIRSARCCGLLVVWLLWALAPSNAHSLSMLQHTTQPMPAMEQTLASEHCEPGSTADQQSQCEMRASAQCTCLQVCATALALPGAELATTLSASSSYPGPSLFSSPIPARIEPPYRPPSPLT